MCSARRLSSLSSSFPFPCLRSLTSAVANVIYSRPNSTTRSIVGIEPHSSWSFARPSVQVQYGQSSDTSAVLDYADYTSTISGNAAEVLRSICFCLTRPRLSSTPCIPGRRPYSTNLTTNNIIATAMSRWLGTIVLVTASLASSVSNINPCTRPS